MLHSSLEGIRAARHEALAIVLTAETDDGIEYAALYDQVLLIMQQKGLAGIEAVISASRGISSLSLDNFIYTNDNGRLFPNMFLGKTLPAEHISWYIEAVRIGAADPDLDLAAQLRWIDNTNSRRYRQIYPPRR